jgi:hypothetical protein
VPFSMKAGADIIGVESPAGRHRCPCEHQQIMEEDTSPVKAVWRGGWLGSQCLFLSPRMAQTQEVLTRLVTPKTCADSVPVGHRIRRSAA